MLDCELCNARSVDKIVLAGDIGMSGDIITQGNTTHQPSLLSVPAGSPTSASSATTGQSASSAQTDSLFTQILLQTLEAALAQPWDATASTSGSGLSASTSATPFASTEQWLLSALGGLSSQTGNTLTMQSPPVVQGLQGVQAPASLQSAIADASAKYGVPSNLIHAVIQQESGYNASAVSPAGAVGLMQLMPATAQQYGAANAYDPVQNIDAGTHFLSDLLTRFQGNQTLAVAAYNAGPGAVDRYGGIPPYPETQQYVTNVLSLAKSAPASSPTNA